MILNFRQLFTNVSDRFLEASGRFPEASGRFPEAFGNFPQLSFQLPGPGRLPGRPGKRCLIPRTVQGEDGHDNGASAEASVGKSRGENV